MNDPYDPRRTDTRKLFDAPMPTQIAQLRQQQDKLFADLASGQQHFRELARSILRLQEHERRRFARDLHDGLGQNITVILHQLQQLTDNSSLDAATAGKIERLVDLCAHALHETRNLARMLRPKILDDLGLHAALNWLGRTVGEANGFRVDVDCDEQFSDPNGDLATLLFRISQEALTNVAKHAQANHVILHISQRQQAVHLLIVDDGKGFDADTAQTRNSQSISSGLGSMRERVALYGGHLSLISEPMGGTQLRIMIPLQVD